MALKGMASVKKQLDKLLAATPARGQGKGWLLLWRFSDLVDLVQAAMPRHTDQPSANATLFVCQKEAERLGIANDPALIAALDELYDTMAKAANAPRPGCAAGAKEWEERHRARTPFTLLAGRRLRSFSRRGVFRLARWDRIHRAEDRVNLSRCPPSGLANRKQRRNR